MLIAGKSWAPHDATSETQCSRESVGLGDSTAQWISGKENIIGCCRAWDELFERATHASSHLSWAWLGTFVESGCCRGTPAAATAWHSGRLVGLLPLDVQKICGQRIGTPMGTGVPSYLGLLLDPEHANAVADIVDLLLRERPVDVLAFHDVHSEDVATRLLLDALGSRSTIRRVPRAVCHSIRLPQTYDEYLVSQTTSKRRAKLRWEERHLASVGSVVVERCSGTEVTDAVLLRLRRIQEDSWMKRRDAVVFRRPLYQMLFLRLAAAGLARAWLLTIDGQDAAFVVGMLAHGRFDYAYTSFVLRYESYSVGKLLTSLVIRDLCNEGVREFDFGHGDGEYKRFWGNCSHTVDRVFVGVSRRGGIAALGMACAWRAVQNERMRGWAKTVLSPLRRLRRADNREERQ